MKYLPLLPGEVDKAVDVYLYAAVDVGVLVYLPGEDGESVGRVGVSVCDGGVIGFENEGEVGELIAETVRAGGRGRHERVIADTGALELIHGGEQQRLKLRAALGGGIDAQTRADALQRKRHAQESPTLIEPRLGSAAVLCGGLARKTSEAQDFGIQREPSPQTRQSSRSASWLYCSGTIIRARPCADAISRFISFMMAAVLPAPALPVISLSKCPSSCSRFS